jgi:hypothetical protein
MSKEAAAEFLRRVSEDRILREQLVKLAHQQGLQFTAEELASMDLGSPADKTRSKSKVSLDALDDEHPGFGVIEVPA